MLGLCRMTLLFVRFCQFVQDSERGRRGIIYPLTYRLCLVYKQRLYKLLRKLSVKNNNNSPCSPPVVSTFSPLENPLGRQILPGKGWEGAGEMPGEGGPGTHHYPSSPAQLLPELDFIHIYTFFFFSLTYAFLYTYNHKYILYIYKETYFLYILYIFHTYLCQEVYFIYIFSLHSIHFNIYEEIERKYISLYILYISFIHFFTEK